MLDIIVAVIVLVLVFTEAYCLMRLGDYIRNHFKQKEEQRREHYRQIAYAEMKKKLALIKSRQDLWDSVTKNNY
jgi:hypothetical protein